MSFLSSAPAIFTHKSIRVLLVESGPTDAACFEDSLRGGIVRSFSISRANTRDKNIEVTFLIAPGTGGGAAAWKREAA